MDKPVETVLEELLAQAATLRTNGSPHLAAEVLRKVARIQKREAQRIQERKKKGTGIGRG